MADEVSTTQIGDKIGDEIKEGEGMADSRSGCFCDTCPHAPEGGPTVMIMKKEMPRKLIADVSEQMGNKVGQIAEPDGEIEIVPMADKDGKCKGSCIRKVGSDWRVVSNKTGKLWPAKYGSKEKAQGALAAYHMSK
jgi:hypothetical protein